jgi:hypothetical protein
MSQLQVNRINDASGGVFAPVSSVFRNRIINGAMTIDQRNAGASVNINNGFSLDRWGGIVSQASKFTVQQDAGAVTPPVGFTDYLGVVSSSAYTVGSSELFSIRQAIEGFNIADLGWGTANAKTVTLSFWVRSSLTGTFGGSLRNSGGTRSYPFSYTISSANTWEQKSITIAGDTGGTWLVTNGIGVELIFSMGTGSTLSGTAGSWAAGNFTSATGTVSVVGTNAATWYVTGVQLEVGTQATSFEYRQYTNELQLCQRYYSKSFLQGQVPVQNVGSTSGALVYATQTASTQFIMAQTNLPVTMRAAPTVTTFNPFAANTGWSASGAGNFTASLYSLGDSSIAIRNDTLVPSSGSNMSIHWTAAIEL